MNRKGGFNEKGSFLIKKSFCNLIRSGLIEKTPTRFLTEPATAEKPVYTMFDWEQCQDVESDHEHNCEFNVGAKGIGQRFLIIPYLQQERSAQGPDSENSAPADGSCYFFHRPLLAENVACLQYISSAFAGGYPRFFDESERR
jgi:hypothetical protein